MQSEIIILTVAGTEVTTELQIFTPKGNKTFLQRIARAVQVSYLTAEPFQPPVKCSIRSTDVMSLVLRIPNIGVHAMFAMLSALTDARAVVNYVEAVQLLGIPSHISPMVTPQEGFVQIQKACAKAVGNEAKMLRKIGAVPMLFLVWLEAVQSSQNLTHESDRLLNQVRASYKEQVRRMTTTPTKFAHDLTLSEQREALVLALLDGLEGSSSSGAVNVLSDAN